MKENKIYQDNEKFILKNNEVLMNSGRIIKNEKYFTKLYPLASLNKRSRKFKNSKLIILSLLLILFILLIASFVYKIDKTDKNNFPKTPANKINVIQNHINKYINNSIDNSINNPVNNSMNNSIINNIISDTTIQTNNISLNEKELIFDNISISYKKAIPFIKKNIAGKLDSTYNSTNTTEMLPLVTAIIPLYNSKKIILRSIRSIQNQDMKNIEIILVDDCSTDDTLSYIEQLQKEDSRIQIIKNKKNMGILYTRSIGALSAKGKYIFPLDNGDMFLYHDVFNTIYNVANKDNFDIIEFRCINVPGLSFLEGNRLLNIMFSYHKINLELKQPELGYFPLQPKNGTDNYFIEDNYLWNKCIKTSVYQKALNLFGEERYNRSMIIHEDFIMVVLLFNIAESFKFIGKYGVLNCPNSSGHSTGQSTINLYEMYILEVLVDFSQDNEKNKKIITPFSIQLLQRNELSITLESKENKKLFKSIFNRIFNCSLISEEDKNKIKNVSSNLHFLN